MKKRVVAGLLAFIMAVSYMPQSAWAAQEEVPAAEEAVPEESPEDVNEENVLLEADGEDQNTVEFNAYAVNSGTDFAQVYFKANEDFTLEVAIDSETPDAVFCQWSYYDETVEDYIGIDGATQTSYVIPKNDRYYRYQCKVYDNDPEEDTIAVEFEVYVESDLSAGLLVNGEPFGAGDDIPAAPGGYVTLSVEADSLAGEYFYQWLREDESSGEYVEIDGATEASYDAYTGDQNYEYKSYTCRVSDGYEEISVDARFYTDNELSISAVGEANLYPEYGDDITMEVEVNALNRENLSFQWIRCYYNDEGEYTEETLDLDPSTSVYSVSDITNGGDYRCIVTDGFGGEDSVVFSVSVDSVNTGFDIWTDKDYIYADYGEPATMTIDYSIDEAYDGKVTYQWYVFDDNDERVLIEGAEGDQYTVPEVTQKAEYSVLVSDGYGSSYYYNFHVFVDNHLEVHALDDIENVRVAPGEDAVLQVTVSADHTEGITYQWYDNNWEEIEGADDDTLTISNVQSRQNYVCKVTDILENTKDVWFTVSVDTGFEAYAAGTDGTSKDVYVVPEEPAILEVAASSQADLTYTWYEYKEVMDEDGYTYEEWTEIDGATDASYTTEPLAEYTEFYCMVADEYGNSANIWFYCYVDNALTAYAAGTEDGYKTLYLPYNTGATLSVEASAAKGDITYQWYDKNDEAIEGATEASFEVPAVTTRSTYYCVVQDEYNGSATVNFTVVVDSGFYAYAAGTSESAYAELNIDVEEPAELKVMAGAEGGVTYQWMDMYEENIEGETSDTYTIPSVTSYGYYYCRVSDKYGRSATIEFCVQPDNHLKVRPKSEGEIDGNTVTCFAPLGGEVELEVIASANKGSLTYTWYKYGEITDEYGDTYESWSEIEGAGLKTLTVENVSGPSNYYCKVKDEYNNTGTAYFDVYVDSRLEAEAVGWDDWEHEATIFVKPHSDVTLEALASSNYPEKLTYRWYSWNDYEEILGTDSSLTIEDVDSRTDYSCTVSDGFGRSITLDYCIHVENGFKAWSALGDEVIKVQPGGSVTLEVAATADDDSPFTYKWSQDWGDYIDGENESTFTVDQVSGDTRYECLVSDRYGNSQWVSFIVVVDTQFTAGDKENHEDNRSIYVTPGSELTLEVAADSVEPEKITYQWYDEKWEEIPSATEEKLELHDINLNATYYCTVNDGYGHSEDVKYNIYIENGFYAHIAGTVDDEWEEYYVGLNEELTMSVDAGADNGSVTYQWYRGGMKLDGATESSYTTGPVTYNNTYTCEVVDQYHNTAEIEFEVYVDSQFEVHTDSTSVFVKPGEDALLTVKAASRYPDKLTYKWHDQDNDSERIDNVTGPQLTVNNVLKNHSYRCYVSDGFGREEEVDFYVYVDSGLKAYVAGSKKQNVTWYLPYNEPVTLQVTADADEGTELSYQWYLDDGHDNTWIRDAYSDTLTVDHLTKYANYYCCVSDQYGNSEWLNFYLYVDSGLEAYAAGTESTWVYRYGAPNEAFTLKVDAICHEGEEITYQWYSRTEDDDVRIPNATTSEYTIDPLTGRGTYYCSVSDAYGRDIDIYFNVSVDNHLEAYVKGTTRTSKDVDVKLGEKAVLEAEASADDKAHMTYVWYKDGEEIDGANGPTFTTDPVTVYTNYECHVLDGYGNEDEVYFYVGVDDGFYAYVSDSNYTYKDITIKAAQADAGLTLSVSAGTADGSPVTYQWYREYDYGGDAGRSVKQNNQTAVIETGALTEGSKYRCEVSDAYGRTKYVHFEINIDNGLSVWTDGEDDWEENIYVAKGETAALKVNAACDTGELSYEWSIMENPDEDSHEWFPVYNQNGKTFVTGPVNYYTRYRCDVTDQYGNSDAVVYPVYVDSGLTACASESGEEYARVGAEPGKPLSLHVDASVNEGESLTYTWYEVGDVLDITGPDLQIDSVTTRLYYQCYVEDAYGHRIVIEYNIYPENHLILTTESAQSGNDAVIEVDYNQPVTLKVKASADNMEGLKYHWHYLEAEGYTGTVLSETDTVTIDAVDMRQYIECSVEDCYGNYRYIDFDVRVKNDLAVTGGDHVRKVVSTGDTVVLSPVITAKDTSDLSYRWYRFKTYSDGLESDWDGYISDDPTYTVNAAEEYTHLQCRVYDRYDNELTIDYQIVIDNDFTAYVKDTTDTRATVFVPAGQTKDLEVAAFAENGEFTYFWYRMYEEPTGGTSETVYYKSRIKNENTAKLTVTAGAEDAEYSCLVRDIYGNRNEVYFTVKTGSVTYEWSEDNKTVTASCFKENGTEEKETVQTTEETEAATCDTAGSVTYTATFENAAFETQTKTVRIPALGHAWGTPSYTWSDDYNTATATRVCSRDKAHVETETVNAAHETVAATCETAGKTTYTATFTNTAFTAQTKEVEIPALGHNWSAPAYTWSDDNKTVTATRTCGNDAAHVETETANVEEQNIAATCEADGKTVYTAVFTNAAFETQTKTETIEKLGHDWGQPSYEWSDDNKTVTAKRVCNHNTGISCTETETVNTECTNPETGKFVYTASFKNTAFEVQSKEVIAKDIRECQINIDPAVYDGSEVRPVSITDGTVKLTEGTDYTVTYSDNINAGTATAIIRGIGNYAGEISRTFIIEPKAITPEVTLSPAVYTYDGNVKTPDVVVKDGEINLTEDVDYSVELPLGRKNAGTYSVAVNLTGNYTGSGTVTFRINRAVQTVTAKAAAASVAVGKAVTISVSGTKESPKLTYKSSNTDIATVSTTGKVTAKKVGTVKITVTAAATTDYAAKSATVSIKVVPAATASVTAANLATGMKVTWKKVTGATGYKLYRNGVLVKKITSGNTVTYSDTKANTNGGKYIFKVVAFAGTGDSTLNKSVTTYRVARPAISSLTSAKTKTMLVKWGKNAKATGYQIQYSTSSTFASGNKTVTVKGAAAVSKTITSLTAKKRYYVRIRTYKTVSGKNYYSAWSAAKNVVTK